MRKKLFLIPLFISLFLLGACSNNSTSQNSESSSSSSSVKTSKLVKSSSQKKSSSNKFSSSSQSSSSSSEVANDSSNAIPSSSVSASSSVSVSSQSQDVTTDNNSVLTSFLNASGVQLGNGDIAFITGENNGMYEIEIRPQSPVLAPERPPSQQQ